MPRGLEEAILMSLPPVHRSRGRRLSVDALLPSLFLYPGLVVIALLSLYPTVYALVVWLQSYTLTRPLARHWVGLDNYVSMVTSAAFWNSVLVTAKYLVIAVGAEVILGFLIALL